MICGEGVRIVRPILGLDPTTVYVVDRVRRMSIRLRGNPWWFNRDNFEVIDD